MEDSIDSDSGDIAIVMVENDKWYGTRYGETYRCYGDISA